MLYQFLESSVGPKTAPAADQKWNYLWNRLAPCPKGLALTLSGIIREVWKSYWTPKKRKGCLMIGQPLKVSERDVEDGALHALWFCTLLFQGLPESALALPQEYM